MTSKSIGYARLNSDFLSEDISFVFENVAEVYQDIGDVETDHRPEFERALEKISGGDEVVIYQLSQLGNNLISLQERIKNIIIRDAKICFIKEGLTLSKADLENQESGFYSSLELLSGFLSDCRREQRETRIARHRKRRQEFTQGDKKDLKEKVQAMIIEGISDKEIADKLDQKLSLVFAIRRGWL